MGEKEKIVSGMNLRYLTIFSFVILFFLLLSGQALAGCEGFKSCRRAGILDVGVSKTYQQDGKNYVTVYADSCIKSANASTRYDICNVKYKPFVSFNWTKTKNFVSALNPVPTIKSYVTFINVVDFRNATFLGMDSRCGSTSPYSNAVYRFNYTFEFKDPGTYSLYVYTLGANPLYNCKDDIGSFDDKTVQLTISQPVLASNCSDKNTILKVSSDSSLGAIWNDSAYSNAICYTDFFPELNEANPHLCNGNNSVAWLHDLRDSLVSAIQYDDPVERSQQIQVCYGNLTCRPVYGNCSGGEKVIMKLSDYTDSTISSTGLLNICCKIYNWTFVPEKANITSAYWADMNSNPIANADKNDRVRLVIGGKNLTLGNMNYAIWKNGSIVFSAGGRAAQYSDRAWISAKINQSGEYTFEAYPTDSPQNIFSEILNVGNGENNSLPDAKLTSPINGQIYFVGENISFNFGGDVDDSFIYDLNFGDSDIIGNSETLLNRSIIHSYGMAGQKNIVLNITDERGYNSIDRISILVIDSLGDSNYTLAYIDNPNRGEAFREIVMFNASSSYAVSFLSGEKRVTCMAGNCPSVTEGCITNFCNVNVEDSPQSYDALNFFWDLEDHIPITREGNAGVLINAAFNTAGSHYARLTTSFSNSSSTAETQFYTSFDKPFCDISGEGWWMLAQVSPSFNSCYRDSVASGSSSTCCSIGYNCNRASGICESQSDIEDCEGYNTQNDCENYSLAIATNDIESKTQQGYCGLWESNGDCYNIVSNCRCSWNENLEKCESAYNMNVQCQDSDIITSGGECVFSTSQNSSCEDGSRSIQWLAQWTGNSSIKPESCLNNARDVKCYSSELNFFGDISMIIALAILFVFYLVRRK